MLQIRLMQIHLLRIRSLVQRAVGPAIVVCLLWTGLWQHSIGAMEQDGPEFFRGLNLNGPAVMIDGHAWDGAEAEWYRCEDKAFESPLVPLVPVTDSERAKMIRSSRWGGNRLELRDIPAGTYTVFLYVWEDNQPETYDIAINSRDVMLQYRSGGAGHWQRLGPWVVVPQDGMILLTSRGGAANFSGVEIWRGEYDGLEEPISESQLAFFEKWIRPLLIDKCYGCHSSGAEELGGELLVDSRMTIRRGGGSGPGVVPGSPARSLVYQTVQYETLQMPPEGKLSEEEIADIKTWIELGAADPRSEATKHAGKRIDLAEARAFWSLRPIVEPDIPAVVDDSWARQELDCFVLAKLEAAGLKPSADADRRTWIRRTTYDLIGLPPQPDEVAAFLSDASDQAYAKVVDRLLDSPRYGERWGRHWMDVVRYADTAGDNSDFPIPQMVRYRDWVIDAFNRDMPYDEFVRDQIAGDLRGGETEAIRQSRIIATGYLANSRRFGSRVDDYPWHLTIEDTIDNLGRTFLGMSLSCARCHDHKFDPITTRDYYGLYGVLASTRYAWPGIELEQRQRDMTPLVARERLPELLRQQAERDEKQRSLDKEVQRWKDKLDKAEDADKSEVKQKLAEAEAISEAHRQQPALFATAYAVSDVAEPHDVSVQIKGDPTKPGDMVRRHFPEVLGGGEVPTTSGESGRRELAEWLLSSENPLTARVMVNRIWHYHFGRGLVPTPNDFGKQGKGATHPELLDYLAHRFRREGWSIKSLHRTILLSRTYGLSSHREAEVVERDPANDWLAGFRRQRLDAESIRDSLLALSGALDMNRPAEHPFPHPSTWKFTQHYPFKATYESSHRSVYLMTQRIQRHPFFAIFDGADPSASTGARMRSTTPLQALFLLNDPLVHQASGGIADRLQAVSHDTSQRVQFAYELLMARPAEGIEVAEAKRFLEEAKAILEREGNTGRELESETWRAYVRALLRLNEWLYLD